MEIDENEIFGTRRVGVLCTDPPKPIDAEANIHRLGVIRIRHANQRRTDYTAMYTVADIIPLLDQGMEGTEVVAHIGGSRKNVIFV